jgi:hypothetical protein
MVINSFMDHGFDGFLFRSWTTTWGFDILRGARQLSTFRRIHILEEGVTMFLISEVCNFHKCMSLAPSLFSSALLWYLTYCVAPTRRTLSTLADIWNTIIEWMCGVQERFYVWSCKPFVKSIFLTPHTPSHLSTSLHVWIFWTLFSSVCSWDNATGDNGN